MIPAVVLFFVTYVLMLTFSKYRKYIAMISGALFIVTRLLPVDKIFGAIDLNVILMIIGTMGIVAMFIESNMLALLADLIMSKVPTVKWAAVALALFAGVVSAFVDNVATVLMVAPIGLEICKKLKVNPISFIIAIAVSSNLQGAATLIGDTTAIMLGSALDMSFLEFFWYKNSLGIFFAVELGALVSAIVLIYLFRKENGKIGEYNERTLVTDYFPTVLILGALLLLIVASVFPNKPDITNGLICCVLLAIGLIYKLCKEKNVKSLIPVFQGIDFETIFILLGIFLMIGGIKEQGFIDLVAGFLANAGGNNIFLLYTIIVWASVAISAIIDNIPYVATMIPVIAGISNALGIDATPLYFGLLSGATLGGNCTPIGASANITGIGILKKNGYEVKNSDFFRIGIPFTIAAIVPAYIYIWLVYGI